jgi:hypothetical protein
MAKKILTSQCPYCDLPMQVETMRCPTCGVKVEGMFVQPMISQLGPEDQQFLEDYLLAGFSIKALEEARGMGYVAIRSRLDKLIENYKAIRKHDAQKRVILEQLRKGEITVVQARSRLEELTGA